MDMQKYVSKLDNNKLKKEYEEYNDLIHNIGCYGTKDLSIFNLLLIEMEDRNLIKE